MDHIHNEAVLVFLNLHKENPNIKRFIKEQQKDINNLNKELNENYKDYLDYLESNIGDDASFTMDELKALLKPSFYVNLNKKEQKEFSYEGFEISIDELEKPVYIKDEGHFFSIQSKERIDIPLRFLNKFIKFLKENNVKYENEYEM